MKVASILRGIRNWHEASLTTRKLSRLSARDLADIGLAPGNVDSGLAGDAERARRVYRYSRW